MGPRRKLVEENRDAIAAAVRRHRGTSVAIFGSVARGDDGEGSDIDFLSLIHISEPTRPY